MLAPENGSQHKIYEVKNMDRKLITIQTGKKLSEKGFEVTLENCTMENCLG